ncbi:malonyl-coenzyme:anthocyanin 5-O-glucoside-6'''-O-malonyltransferase-like [Olea europaea var. sylvestris]|uniref:malonyl-coenzyme:anthocyanin 5-O-glucoside-6'''-O-malonyltransferase-like n=1 Tax=Olea europaea var. sylvestris TaxID=158386 RepID=UPI000C1D7C49|nr:malonyl-coenzyme:anthocyanin 5-O-glucoside-6'''-O-malonyltransferase-like [Olea europaea var. sylvestris]
MPGEIVRRTLSRIKSQVVRALQTTTIKARVEALKEIIPLVSTVQEADAQVANEDEEDEIFMATCFSTGNSSKCWLIDSGCTNHMTYDRTLFKELKPTGITKVKIGNGCYIPAKGKGNIAITTNSGTKIISDALYVPDIDQNLLSVSQLIEKGFKVSFENWYCHILNAARQEILRVKMRGFHFLNQLGGPPNLKDSLSLTLKHYIPLASNILYPASNEKPFLRHVVGDSLSLTIAESNEDFDSLIANYARDADQFYPFVPQLPPPKEEPEYKTFPVFCVQVTFFPSHGVCIGFTNHHAIGDASSIVGFIKAWASISKFRGDSQLIDAKSLPLFDRYVIKDPRGIGDLYWDQLKNLSLQFPPSHLPINKVRATYILHQADIKKLKDSVLARKPDLVQPSSFVVTIAYVWTCLVKSGPVSGEKVDANESEYFSFAVDCRERMNPPVPTNYFGNCIGVAIVTRKHHELIENDGFFIAAESVAEIIRIKVKNKDEMMKGAANWLAEMGELLMGKRNLSVAGSPKLNFYDVDYGWGRPKKMEAVSIDGDHDSFSLCKFQDSEGGLEIGLSLPKTKMDAFAAIFASGLGVLSKEVFHSD